MVKANYVKLGGPEGAGARGRVRASARYYGHRPNEEGRREWRDAFSGDRDRMTKEEAYERVSGAEGEYAYRIVLSPGREMDEGDLMEWTRGVMAMGAERGWFEEDRGPEEWAPEGDSEGEAERWVAWAHTDHTDNPHVHVLAFTDRRLDREDFAGMREEGDLAVEERLDWRAEVEQDPMHETELDRDLTPEGWDRGRTWERGLARWLEAPGEGSGDDRDTSPELGWPSPDAPEEVGPEVEDHLHQHGLDEDDYRTAVEQERRTALEREEGAEQE